MKKQINEILKELKKHSSQKNIKGMERFGITSKKKFGVPMPVLRKMAKHIGKNHELALKLYPLGYHDTRLLASFIEIPEKVTKQQMDKWVNGFESWADCDSICGALLDKVPGAREKAYSYIKSKKEFVKRAGFVIITWQAVHDKMVGDKVFIDFLDIIERESHDERNFIKKAVNWSLRTIGKRNERLRKLAIKKAREIEKQNSKPAKWIAKNALRELENYRFK